MAFSDSIWINQIQICLFTFIVYALEVVHPEWLNLR